MNSPAPLPDNPPAGAGNAETLDTSAIRGLVAAATKLLDHGGSIVNRNALRQAVERFQFEGDIAGSSARRWVFTPTVKWVLCRAAKRAEMSGDQHIRTDHIEAALKEIPHISSR